MDIKSRFGFLIAGIFGLSALILDAVGAHFLPKRLTLSSEEMHLVQNAWQTATKYQLIHALLLVFFARCSFEVQQWNITCGIVSIIIGVIFFCGGIYIKTLTDIAYFGAITPYGGIFLMFSWVFLVMTGFRIYDVY